MTLTDVGIRGLLAGAMLLCSCTKVTKVKGPDGQEGWLLIECRGSQTACKEQAEEECPSGYRTATESREDQITITQINDSQAMVTAGENMLIKCSAEASDQQRSAASRTSNQNKAPTGTSPTRKLGGFTLATPLKEAIELCENAGNTWTPQDDGGVCSKTVSRTLLEGPVQIRTFKERVYSLSMKVDVKSDAPHEWMSTFQRAMIPIINTSGDSKKDKVTVPARCKETFVACLRSGEASLSAHWEWPKQGFADVRTIRPAKEDERPQIEIVVSMPERDTTADPKPTDKPAEGAKPASSADKPADKPATADKPADKPAGKAESGKKGP